MLKGKKNMIRVNNNNNNVELQAKRGGWRRPTNFSEDEIIRRS